ncbi:MAG: hypothetical protein LCH81_14095 [Bacteroidetes bacterium]|nr:hypothetical protein [Bacteroidota bacterium]
MTTLFSNWHFMRIFRAAIAVWSVFEFNRTHDALILMLGGIFALQAIFDIGCCGAAGCAVPQQRTMQQEKVSQEIDFEEVK